MNGDRPPDGPGPSAGLRWALNAVIALSAMGLIAGLCRVALLGAYLVWLIPLFVLSPITILLVIVAVRLRDRGIDRAPEDAARRALSWMLGGFACVIDWILPDGSLWHPPYSAGLVTIAGIYAIQVVRIGRARYLIPTVISGLVIVAMAVAIGSPLNRYFLLPVIAALLMYAGCMFYLERMALLQRAGIGARLPIPPSTPSGDDETPSSAKG